MFVLAVFAVLTVAVAVNIFEINCICYLTVSKVWSGIRNIPSIPTLKFKKKVKDDSIRNTNKSFTNIIGAYFKLG